MKRHPTTEKADGSMGLCCPCAHFLFVFQNKHRCLANQTASRILQHGWAEPCELEGRPSMTLTQLHPMAVFCAGVAVSSWVWTKASVLAWRRWYRRKFHKRPLDERVRIRKHKIIAQVRPSFQYGDSSTFNLGRFWLLLGLRQAPRSEPHGSHVHQHQQHARRSGRIQHRPQQRRFAGRPRIALRFCVLGVSLAALMDSLGRRTCRRRGRRPSPSL